MDIISAWIGCALTMLFKSKRTVLASWAGGLNCLFLM